MGEHCFDRVTSGLETTRPPTLFHSLLGSSSVTLCAYSGNRNKTSRNSRTEKKYCNNELAQIEKVVGFQLVNRRRDGVATESETTDFR